MAVSLSNLCRRCLLFLISTSVSKIFEMNVFDFFNFLVFGCGVVRVCLPLTTISNTPRHQTLGEASSAASTLSSRSSSSSFRPPIVHSFLKPRLARSTRSLLFSSTADHETQTGSRKVTSNTSRLVPICTNRILFDNKKS